VCDEIQYVGPPPLAMSATGINKQHVEFVKALYDAVFDQ
jgi:hypothetical protein